MAIVAAERRQRVLLASSDPAHSLGDALQARVGAAPVRIPIGRRRSIRAVEIDAPGAFSRWLGRRRDALGEAIEHGTWLDRDDIDALLDLSLPGIDELMALVEIVRLADSHPTDLVVVDMAPTGHALRLIDAPSAVAAVADVLDALQEHHRALRSRFGRGGRREEAADRVIAEIASDARRLAGLVRDPVRTRFEWVLLPEALAVEESRRAIVTLRQWRVPISGVVVNRLLPEGPPCPLCDPRRSAERRLLRSIRVRTRDVPVRTIFEAAEEPRGPRALARIGRALESRRTSRVGSFARSAARVVARPAVERPVRCVVPEAVGGFNEVRLLLFGGKGGVGKTTVAAAAALRLARADSRRRVLLISTDPAHSLGDVLRHPVKDRATTLPGGPRNLRVRELDASAALGAARPQLETAIADITTAVGAGASGSFTATATSLDASDLVDLAPPGIDELFGLLTLVDVTDGDNDLVVVDTAPTGHTLRLLAMPEVAAEWVQTLIRVLLKYRAVAKPGRLAATLVDLSRSIRRLSALLHDERATAFVPVTRAAELPRLETIRLLASLRDAAVAVRTLIVNARVLTPAACQRCRRVALAERAALASLRTTAAVKGPLSGGRSTRCVIIQTPVIAPPPRGIRALERWAGRWIA
jgi:arsenite-transporting ATPase